MLQASRLVTPRPSTGLRVICHQIERRPLSHRCRDEETGYVSVNDEECWSKKFNKEGTQQCGKGLGRTNSRVTNEQSVHVHCEVDAVDGKLQVRVYTDLNQNANDESFAIDNVTITKIPTTSAFAVLSLHALLKPI